MYSEIKVNDEFFVEEHWADIPGLTKIPDGEEYPYEVSDYEVHNYGNFVADESIEFDAMLIYIQTVKDCTPHFGADRQSDEFDKLCFLKFLSNTWAKYRKRLEITDKLDWKDISRIIYENWDEMHIFIGNQKLIRTGLKYILENDKRNEKLYWHITSEDVNKFFNAFNVYKFNCLKKLNAVR